MPECRTQQCTSMLLVGPYIYVLLIPFEVIIIFRFFLKAKSCYIKNDKDLWHQN
jgi:hypothetical protein